MQIAEKEESARLNTLFYSKKQILLRIFKVENVVQGCTPINLSVNAAACIDNLRDHGYTRLQSCKQ